MKAKLEIENLTKEFPSRHGPTVALSNVDLTVGEGELVTIVGASGCGKSTLLEIIAGFTEPTSGQVLLDGEPIVGPGPDRGLVFQSYSLYPWRTVHDNVAFGLELGGMSRVQVEDRVGYYLDVMNLTKFARRPTEPTLWRHAAADRHREVPSHRPRSVAARRAVRGVGCPNQVRDAGAAYLGGDAQDDSLGDT